MYAIRIDGRTVEELTSLRVAYIRVRYDLGIRINDEREYQSAIADCMDITPGMRRSYVGAEGETVEIVSLG